MCQNCLSIFPDISKINLCDYYTASYRHDENFFEKIVNKLNYLPKLNIIKSIFNSKNISILDVGCGNGNFLKELPQGYNKTGIDIKIDNQKQNLLQADFLKHKFKQKYDLICFWHSLEHFVKPIDAIIKAKKLLNKNGVIIISVPVSDSFSFKFNQNKAFHLDPPRHIFIPNTNKFKNILNNYFSIVKITSQPFEFPLDLFWTLKTSHYQYLIPTFPVLKLIHTETKIYICKKN